MIDTVKLIIEIHKTPKNNHERWVLAHGIPLDDVKAEIEHMACRQYEHRLMLDRQEVIDILDNICKVESEDKE